MSSRMHNPSVQFLLVTSFPWQYLPPLLGVGLEQLLLLTLRQSVEHEDQADQEVQPPSTAGQTREQDFFSMAGPSHPGPPLMGAGESHFLFLLFSPRPQTVLQPVHSDHSPHAPGTYTVTRAASDFLDLAMLEATQAYLAVSFSLAWRMRRWPVEEMMKFVSTEVSMAVPFLNHLVTLGFGFPLGG